MNEQGNMEFTFENMMKCYKKATEENDVNSQLKLGNCYYYGRGIEQDYKKQLNDMKRQLSREMQKRKTA